MKPSKTSSSADSAQNANNLSMNGKTPEEWEAGRLTGPLSKQEMFVLLKKLGKLPADAEYKPAA